MNSSGSSSQCPRASPWCPFLPGEFFFGGEHCVYPFWGTAQTRSAATPLAAKFCFHCFFEGAAAFFRLPCCRRRRAFLRPSTQNNPKKRSPVWPFLPPKKITQRHSDALRGPRGSDQEDEAQGTDPWLGLPGRQLFPLMEFLITAPQSML